ncbi:MAG: hypothetical protein ABR551_05420 [Gemmatimonadales bacterium]
MRSTRHLPSVLILAVSVLLPGCGVIDRAGTEADAPPTASYTLTGGALHGPDTLPAGPTMVTLEVEDGVLDQVALIRLEEGHSIPEFLTGAEVAYPPVWAHFAGGPNAALPGAPTGSVVMLSPGQWLALAFDIGPDGFPRVRHQASRPLTVVGNRAPADPPVTSYALQLFDYGFRLSGPLIAGTHVLDVLNMAPQRHEVILARLRDGQGADDMATWLVARRRGEAVGEAPGELVGGVAALTQNERNAWTVTVTPGTYALLCLLADDGDGRPHLFHGHLQTIVVAETVEQLSPASH